MTTRLHPLLLAAILALAACTSAKPPGGPERAGIEEHSGSAATGIALLQEELQKTASALKLTPTQSVLWDNYQDKIGALMADQMKLQPYRSSRQSAMQQIAQKVDTVRNRLTAMEDIQESAGKLYAALDDEQKRIADQTLAPTVPALYSGLAGNAGGSPEGRGGGERPGSRRGPGGGMGGPGGGFGRN